MDSLYIVMPAYNEEESIEAVVRQWYFVLEGKSEDSRLVIADSGSTDGTHSLLENLKQVYPKIEILEQTQKQHGPKLIALYKNAIYNKADYVFQTDSDGQTNPDEFEHFWELRDKFDVILGNRSIRGDGKSRAFVEHVVCVLIHLYFGVKVPDANAPFRLMKTSVIEKYINRLANDYKLPNIMMTTYFAYYKEKLTFKEISFKPRQAGKNSIDLIKITKIGIEALRDFSILKKGMK